MVATTHGTIYALSGLDGAVLWAYDAKAPIRADPVIGDLNADGLLDVVLVADRRVIALEAEVLPALVAVNSGGKGNTRLAGDLDQDGIPDLVRADGTDHRFVSGRTGQMLWRTAASGSLVEVVRLERSAGAEDAFACLVEDASGELVMVSMVSLRTGNTRWRRSFLRGRWHVRPLGDVNQDRVPDLLVEGEPGLESRAVALSGDSGAVLFRLPPRERFLGVVERLAGGGRGVVLEDANGVRAVSGATGAPAWEAKLEADAAGRTLLAFPGSGDIVAVRGGTVEVRHGSDGTQRWTRSSPDPIISAILFPSRAPDPDRAVTLTRAGTLECFDARTGATRWTLQPPGAPRRLQLVRAQPSAAASILCVHEQALSLVDEQGRLSWSVPLDRPPIGPIACGERDAGEPVLVLRSAPTQVECRSARTGRRLLLLGGLDPGLDWAAQAVDLAAYRPRSPQEPIFPPAPVPSTQYVLEYRFERLAAVGLLLRHEGGSWVLHRVRTSLERYRESHPVSEAYDPDQIREITEEDFRSRPD